MFTEFLSCASNVTSNIQFLFSWTHGPIREMERWTDNVGGAIGQEKNSSSHTEGRDGIQEQVASQLIFEGCMGVSLYDPWGKPWGIWNQFCLAGRLNTHVDWISEGR